jgi:hypothetical protein
MVDDSVLTNAPHLHVTPHELEAFATAPLSVLGLEDWVTQVPKTGDKVDGKLGFDVQSHPDAQSKVAQDMHLRLVRDMKEYADSTNCSLVTLLKFLQAPHEMLARDEQHTHTYTKTSALTETSLQLDKLVRYNLSKRAVAVCCRVLQGVAVCCSVSRQTRQVELLKKAPQLPKKALQLLQKNSTSPDNYTHKYIYVYIHTHFCQAPRSTTLQRHEVCA